MSRTVTTKTYASRPAWRKHAFHDEVRLSKTLDSGNGTTLFGEVLSGALMAKNAADGNVRPLALQALANPISTGNEGDVADAAGFYVADVIDFVAGVDSLDTITLDASGSSDEIDVTALEPGVSRIRVILSDPSGATQPLDVIISDDGTNLDIDVSLETDGGSAIVSTVAEVIAALNDEAGYLVFAELSAGSGAATCIAVTAAPLAGGFLLGQAINVGRNVTGVDKTSTPNTVTFDGGVVELPAGVVLMLEDMTPERFVGILDPQPNTKRLLGDDVEGFSEMVTVSLQGYAWKDRLSGHDDSLDRYMTGARVEQGVLGPGQAPTFKFILE